MQLTHEDIVHSLMSDILWGAREHEVWPEVVELDAEHIWVELAEQIRSVCPRCGHTIPHRAGPVTRIVTLPGGHKIPRDLYNYQHHCGVWVMPVHAATIIPVNGTLPDDLEKRLLKLLDQFTELKEAAQDEIRAEALDRAKLLHEQVLARLAEGDTSSLYTEPPQWGHYTTVADDHVVTVAEVFIRETRHPEVDVRTPVTDLPPTAQNAIAAWRAGTHAPDNTAA
jgi:hypothetical protein